MERPPEDANVPVIAAAAIDRRRERPARGVRGRGIHRSTHRVDSSARSLANDVPARSPRVSAVAGGGDREDGESRTKKGIEITEEPRELRAHRARMCARWPVELGFDEVYLQRGHAVR